MKYRHTLTLLGVVLILLGLVERSWFLVLIWLGCNFLILGWAYSRNYHRIFGKRTDGSLPLWSWLFFFPFLIYTMFIWHLVRLFSREPSQSTVSEHLVVGRRLLTFEVDGQFDNYIDLTAEFHEPLTIRRSHSYQSFPILDGTSPTPKALRAALAGLRPGRTFIHCAQGHGRTGLFALAVLLSSGKAQNVEDGLEMLTVVRPGIRLSKDQHACIYAFARQIATER
jgi:hypothetical protein